MPKTAIIDGRVPLGKVYVELTVDEVLEACKRFESDKKFDEELAKVYNKDKSMTKIEHLEREINDLEFFMRIPTVNAQKKRELEVECAYKQKEIQDRAKSIQINKTLN